MIQAKKDLLNYRISRAEESLEETRILASASHWNACVNRLYYACFYIVSALLIKNDLSSAKHSGIRSLFNRYYVKTGIIAKNIAEIYNFLFERRQESDYDDFVTFSEFDVTPWIDDTDIFINIIKKLLTEE
ncbi:MAG: HEPN domain-containing protein [Spirochaetota bacterium]